MADVERLYRWILRRKLVAAVLSQLLPAGLLWLILAVLVHFVVRFLYPAVDLLGRWQTYLVVLVLGALTLLPLRRRRRQLAEGFAARAMGERLLAEGDRPSAAIYLKRSLRILSELIGENRAIVFQLRRIRTLLAECEEAVVGHEETFEAQYRAAVLGNTAVDAASLIWHRSSAGATSAADLDRLLRRFRRDFPQAGRGLQLSAVLAQLGELAYALGSTDRAYELLEAALESSPHRNETEVLAHALMGAIDLARGSFLLAVRRALKALAVQQELGSPMEFAIFPDDQGAKAWRQIEERIDRPLPGPPAAVLYGVLSAIYRSLGLPRSAWPCCEQAYRSAWEARQAFARWHEMGAGVLTEFALIAARAGELSASVVPAQVLADGVALGGWPLRERPEYIRDLEVAAASVLARHELHSEGVGEISEHAEEHRGESCQALRVLAAMDRAVEDGPATSAVPDLPDPSAVESPWELSRWGLVAERSGSTRRAQAFQEAAAVRCLALPPRSESTWILLRHVRLQKAGGDDQAAAEVCASWLGEAIRNGWTREACACLELLFDLTPAAVGHRRYLRDEARCPLERLHGTFLAGRSAYRARDYVGAREALIEYLDGVEEVRGQLELEGIRARVQPDNVAAAFAMVVDSFGHQPASIGQALGWSERSKSWNLRDHDRRSVAAPIAARWPYPFGFRPRSPA